MFFSDWRSKLTLFARTLSLSQRVKATFIVSFCVFCGLSLLVVFAATKGTEDYIFEKQLSRVVTQFRLHYANRDTFLFPEGVTAYPSFADIPPSLAVYIGKSTPGIYELEHPGEEDFHYAIAVMPDNAWYYFIYDVNDIEISESLERMMMQIIFASFTLFIVLFFMIFHLVLKRSMAPMFTLIEQVKKSGDAPGARFVSDYKYQDDEIGLLNKTLVEHAQRIEAFVQREREFTNFASHELRTPVTVIKGVNELLKLHCETNPGLTKPLARLERAVNSMEDMITVLLELAREEGTQESEQATIATIVQEIMQAFQGQAEKNGKTLSLHMTSSASETIPRVNGLIVMGNLVRNAIQHSTGTDIELCVADNVFRITNTLQDTQQHKVEFFSGVEQGYGLGKIIVERICHQQNWHYTQRVEAGKITATIRFSG